MSRPAHPASRLGPRIAVVVVVGLLGIALVVATLTGRPPRAPEPGPAPPPKALPTAGQRGVYPRFAPDNVFGVDVAGQPVDPKSRAMIANLLAQITPHYGGIAALNTQEYNPVLHVVDATTPRVTVRFEDCQDKGYTPEGLFDGPKYFVDVPVPADAQVAKGTDSTITLWSPSTDQLWEFWVMKAQGQGGWSACWGGRIDHVSANRGYFPKPYGVSASGLVTVGSMITLEEARARRIDHAMGLALIAPARWDRWRFPAQRSDGTDPAPDAIPQGARLRLDPSVDVSALGLTPLGEAIARAAQKYGFIVVDTAAAVAVMAESGLPDKTRTGRDPWSAILGDVPTYEQLRGFPWARMQVLSAPDKSP
ncbi:MAG: hypothetical protein Q4P32_10030 [Micrococcales bacterium]|nr:hypothetical protein [Micrococcales bacterium]